MFGYAVVLYLHSTSNHNPRHVLHHLLRVVLYLHSTSNHNQKSLCSELSKVVLYLHSTSNHNDKIYHLCRFLLYYIFILHQTTTFKVIILLLLLLYYIFILHQTTTNVIPSIVCVRCIISSFYIKPQRGNCYILQSDSCIISSFYIKPQPKSVPL